MKLVIIEGAGKKETIEKYLGAGYKVYATKGHVRDLPVKSLGVDIKNNFEPKYEPMSEKRDIIKKMRTEAAEAESVFLATDPDREGEAISWHVAHVLKIPPEKKIRIEFNEISKKAVSDALISPRAINMDLVNAQQARRVLDRLVGYKVSPLVCKRIGGSQSAGRVQSVTLRLVIERDREIAEFKPEEYWNFNSILSKKEENEGFKAALTTKNDKKFKIRSAEDVEEIKNNLDGKPYVVSGVKKTIALSKAAPPFVTSTMQQDALNKLGLSLKQTSMAAQNLYEGVDIAGEGKVALVTYIRTDSTRVSADAINSAREFIKENYGEKYIPKNANIYATKKGAQDAHEAIRPITLSRTPESLKKLLQPNLYKLYKLIYERFLASQMSPAEYDSLNIDIQNGDYGFKVSGKTMIFPGFTKVYKAYEDEKEEESGKLPQLTEGEILKFLEYKYEQKFTKPPAHYTEASLVKAMEEKGIGRPATYTPTVALLFSREYMIKDGKFVKATELGMKVTDMLTKYFPDILDVKFTAEMEEMLDTVEDGGIEWQNIISEFYSKFAEELTAAYGDKDFADDESEYDCPDCGKKLYYRLSKFGKFLGCSGYPDCKKTFQIDEDGKPVVPKEKQTTGEVCKLCGKPMAIKNGRFGQFLGCTGYPQCKNIVSLNQPQAVEAEVKTNEYGNCPVCSKPLVKRRGRNVFFGCSGYPQCKFASQSKIVEGKCPSCEAHLVEKAIDGKKFHVCGKTCGHMTEVPSDKAEN